jgi:formate hydrogenlyase subunit 3/multisubunit Na+/H+ antiporter MnhD subunit
MLTILMLAVSGLIALKSTRLSKITAMLGLLLFPLKFSFEWLPGIIFSWAPKNNLLFGVFSLIFASYLIVSKSFNKIQNSFVMFFMTGIFGIIGSTSPYSTFFFFELMIFPVFYIIRKEDPDAAVKYLGTMHIASVLVLSGILGSSTTSSVLLTIGFGISMGLFPFHTWITETTSQLPLHLSLLINTMIVSIGAYGLLEYSRTPLVILPLGIISAIYGSLHASSNEDVKKILSYSTVSQMGLIGAVASFLPEAASALNAIHSLSKAVLHLSFDNIISVLKKQNLSDISISSRTLFFSVGSASLALAGMAPFSGFLFIIEAMSAGLSIASWLPMLLVFAIVPTILYCEKFISIFLGVPEKKMESAVPAVLSIILAIGGLAWIFS